MDEIKQDKPSQEKSRLQEVLGKLSIEQIRYVIARQEVATDKEAAESIGIKPDTIYQWRHSGHPIDEALRLMAVDGLEVAQNIRRRNLAKAMMTKVEGLDSRDESLKQRVATEIIEWEMGKATQKQEVSGKDGGELVIRLQGNINPDDV